MADSVCVIKPRGERGILGVFNSHHDHPPQVLATVSSQVLIGNIQYSHTGVHSSASSANKSTDYPKCLRAE